MFTAPASVILQPRSSKCWINFERDGCDKAVKLVAAFALGKRIAEQTLSLQKLDSPSAVYALLGPEMRALRQESLRVVLLDTRYHLIRVQEVSLGSTNESIAHPREVF